MKVYSPSQTETYLFCPMKRWLYSVEKVRPRILYARDTAAIVGRGLAEVAAIVNAAKKQGERDLSAHLQLFLAAGTTALDQDLARLDHEGYRFWNSADRDRVRQDLQNAITLLVEYDATLPPWEILDIELTLPDHGFARLDLGVRSPTGALGVVDYKVKMKSDVRYRQTDLDRYARSWQGRHYVWSYSQYKHEPVEWWGIVLVILSPKPEVVVQPFFVGPDAQAQWLAFARQTWADMEAEDLGHRVTRGQTKCADEFGPCEYRRWDWELFGQRDLLREDYVFPEDTKDVS